MTQCIGFPPIIGKNAHTLILGSMPGIQSLTKQQYYAHPQNAFWKIMAALFGMPADDYAARVRLIEKNNLVLWDSLKACYRPGSLDSEIDAASIEANDFESLFRGNPNITRVFFNGAKSEEVFRRHVLPQLPAKIKDSLSFARLPSTSPAHAGMPFQEKLKQWSVVRKK